MKKLFLIDAYALIFKYYYAFMGRPMRNRDGMNTSVVFGFTKFLRDIIRREHPDLLGVAFDPPGGSFRRRIYPLYKANRPATPEDIITSVPYVKRLLAAMCIPVLEVEDYEADDVIGTLAHKGVAAGYEVYMVTPDKDYGQLVREHCSIYKQKGDGIEIVDVEAIRAHYGFDDPALVSDVLALWGDASDNIPGVPGIGEKGAAKLVAKWGGVENIILNAEAIGGKTGQSISSWVNNLRRAKALTQIVLDVPIEFSAESLTMCSPDTAALRTLFAELNFTSMLRDIDNIAPAEPDAPTDDTPRQQRRRSWPIWREPNRLQSARRRCRVRATCSRHRLPPELPSTAPRQSPTALGTRPPSRSPSWPQQPPLPTTTERYAQPGSSPR